MKQRSFVVYLLLNIVTCGIYGIYFWYVFTENLNQICAEKVPNDKPSMNYILVLLLSIVTCGIFYYFCFTSRETVCWMPPGDMEENFMKRVQPT